MAQDETDNKGRKIKFFDADFKKSAVDLVLKTDRKACEIEKKLGLCQGAISAWKKELKEAAKESIVAKYNGCRIVDNIEAVSFQLYFSTFPKLSIRTYLKTHGFKWSAAEQCWRCSRYSAKAVYHAKKAIDKMNNH